MRRESLIKALRGFIEVIGTIYVSELPLEDDVSFRRGNVIYTVLRFSSVGVTTLVENYKGYVTNGYLLYYEDMSLEELEMLYEVMSSLRVDSFLK